MRSAADASDRELLIERLQRMAAAVVATHPAGSGLCLVGGFRYRPLDRAARRPVDIDYHWTGDLDSKQRELADLFAWRLLPDARRRLGLDGSVRACPIESPAAAVIELAFWRIGTELGRLEIPIDIIRLECLDPPTVRTTDGILYRTVSNADMLEAKVIAVVGRMFLEHRDLVDIFLFASHAAPDATERLSRKLGSIRLSPEIVSRRIADLGTNHARHIAAVDHVIREQLDDEAAELLRSAGGGALVVSAASTLLTQLLGPSRGGHV
jgi:hypothetical protein